MTDREKIKMGECVSLLTTEKCPVCVDRCEAFQYFRKLQEQLDKNNIKRSKQL